MEQIAIIGMGCLFPGSKTPEQFYQSLIEGQTFLEEDFLYDIDANCFEVLLDQAQLNQLDEIFLYTLYVAHEALKDSGYLKDRKTLENTGLIIGSRETVNKKTFELFEPLYMSELEQNIRQLLNNPDFHFDYSFAPPNSSPLNIFHFSYPTIFASQTLSIKGPAFAIEAACASSIYTIKLASYYLLSGQTDLMLAGGVFFGKRNKAIPYFFKQLGVIPPENSVSRPLDRESGGMVANEGAGIVVLKRLSDALRDKDKIYAVIEHAGWSNNGAGKYFLAPSKKGEVQAYENAYQNSQINNVDYIECHATGTRVGDFIELNSLEEFYGNSNPVPLFGAVKGNIGHILNASGIAGLIKVIYSMKNGIIPATVNITTPLSSTKGIFSGDNMVVKNTAWPETGKEKRAAINAFGFGGTNGHLVIREYLDNKTNEAALPPEEHLEKEKVSIIGMGAHFGEIEGIKNFSDALYYGRHPNIREDVKRFRGFNENPAVLKDFLNEKQLPGGHYFTKVDFNYLENKVHPQEEVEALTKELIMLKVAGEALEDAGFDKASPKNVGVIISAKQNLSQLHFYVNAYLPDFIRSALKQANISLDESKIKELIKIARNSIISRNAGFDFIATGIGPIIATRIASVWNLIGPAFKLCCLENSFMRSLEIADLLLKADAVDAVLVGAIDADPLLESAVWHRKYGKNYGLDQKNFFFGEGAAAIVLKRNTRAFKGNHKVYADIESYSLLREDSSPLPFPSPKKFSECFGLALQRANITSDKIGYIEFSNCFLNEHLKTLSKMLDLHIFKEVKHPINAGSVQLNCGYSFMSSQIASCIKATLMLNYGFQPAVPKSFNPHQKECAFEGLRHQSTSSYWLDDENNKFVSVLGAGFDGTCSHLVLTGSNRKPEPIECSTGNSDHNVFILANKDMRSLLQDLYTFKEAIKNKNPLYELAQKHYSCFKNQKPFEKGLTIVLTGESREELLLETERALNEIDSAFKNKKEWNGLCGSYFTPNPMGTKGKLAIAYPPSGLNSPNALYELISTFPQLSFRLNKMVQTAHHKTKEQLRDIDSSIKRKDQLPLYMDGILGNLFTHLLLNVLKIPVDAFLGCSFGELVMYSSTDILLEEQDADFITDLIAPLIAKLSDAQYIKNYFKDDKLNWATFFCNGSRENINTLLDYLKQENRVFLTIKASPKNVIISGNQFDCEKILKKANCFAYQISRDIFVHTPLAMDFYDEIVQSNFQHPFRIKKRTNAVYYRTHDCLHFGYDKKEFAYAMADCICRTIDFESVVKKAYQDGARIFIGMDSGNLCESWIKDTLENKDALILPINQNSLGFKKSVRALIVKLISHGVLLDMDWFFKRSLDHRPIKDLIKTISNEPPTIKEMMLKDENIKIFQSQTAPVDHAFLIRHEIPRVDKNKKLLQEDTASSSESHSAISHNHNPNPLLQKLFDQNFHIHHSFFQVQERLMQLIDNNISRDNVFDKRQDKTPAVLKKLHLSTITPHKKVIWSEKEILEMTVGRLSNILGQRYEEADQYPTRARLPLPPFMFVSRVTGLDATFGELKPSMIEIEYDIPQNAWFCMDGKASFAIVNESSHCGILLLSYIGVDIIWKGKLHYRAIDSSVTIYSEKMLMAGETFKGKFNITSFIKNKDTMLAFFTYDIFDAENTHLVKINGAGGFFSREELQKAKGYIPPKLVVDDKKIKKPDFSPLLRCEKTSFSDNDIVSLQNGRHDLCFGKAYPAYDNIDQLYPKDFKMLSRVSLVDLKGGPSGLGFIVGEADIDSQHWVFDAHFKDDPVLPATFMIEGGIQLLTFYTYYLGLKEVAGPNSHPNTLLGSQSSSKFRGEIKKEKTTLRYECMIKSITTHPEVIIVADINIFNCDKLVCLTQNMGMKLKQKEYINEASLLAI